jgi:hypothetical protein
MIAGEKRHSALYPELKYAHQKVPPEQHCAAAEILLCARKNYHRDAPSSWQTEPSSPPVCALLPQPCGGVLQGTFPSHLCTCTGPCMIERSVPETECPVAIDICLDSEHGRPTGTSEAELNWRPAMEQVRFIHCASLARRRSRTTTLRLPQLCDFSLYIISAEHYCKLTPSTKTFALYLFQQALSDAAGLGVLPCVLMQRPAGERAYAYSAATLSLLNLQIQGEPCCGLVL